MPYVLPNKWRQFFTSCERAVFRHDPVPGTGVCNWHFGTFYKTPCCLQERRLYGDPNHRQYGRGKRYPSNLPQAYDDRTKSRYYDKRSWKKVKKKKQWMKKGDNIMYPTFTTLGAESSADDIVEGISSQKKKLNYDMSETKVNSDDYTRPGKDASQTEDDDLRGDLADKEDYESSGKDRLTTNEDQKNPEKDEGQPGMRIHQDPFADVGQPPVDDILPPEDDTPIAEDDSLKHGTRNKYRIGGGEGKTGTEMK
jgi:hypothetical protein